MAHTCEAVAAAEAAAAAAEAEVPALVELKR